MTIGQTAADIELAMERPLHTPALKLRIADIRIQAGDESLDADALFSQFVVDKPALALHLRQALQTRSQVTLVELLEQRPLRQGLAELVAYLELASASPATVIDDAVQERVTWRASDGRWKQAELARVIFSR